VEQNLTSDRTALVAALARLQTRTYTRIDIGLAVAAGELASARRLPSNLPVIVLLTDGKANPEPIQTAEDQARRAKDAGVTIFAIGLGPPGELDHDALARIATRPEYYYQTPDPDDLAAIYAEIARSIPCPASSGSRVTLVRPARGPPVQ
jgi:Mg-chelatase subunit ChlD